MNSFIQWIGGKKLLRNKIIEMFPEGLERYIEVFGGAGWVLFHKERHAALEVFNDINSNLINLYRCIKYHSEELQRELDGLFVSREIFFDFQDQIKGSGLTDIQRAARYFYMIKTSFGGNTRSFNLNKRDLKGNTEYLSEISERLQNVVVENKDFGNLIDVYDREKALFFLDPPYYKMEKYYDILFLQEDHLRLCSKIRDIKGKFILSYNDCEFVRELYKDFNIHEVSRNHSLSSKQNDYRELLITNY